MSGNPTYQELARRCQGRFWWEEDFSTFIRRTGFPITRQSILKSLEPFSGRSRSNWCRDLFATTLILPALE